LTQSIELVSPGKHVQQSLGMGTAGPLQPPAQHSWPTTHSGGQVRSPPESLASGTAPSCGPVPSVVRAPQAPHSSSPAKADTEPRQSARTG